jgi:hypothetical protein
MKRIASFLFAVSLFALAPAHLFADAGIDSSYIVLSGTVGGTSQFSIKFFQDKGSDGVNPAFNLYNLGTYNPSAGDALILNGGESDTYSQDGYDLIESAQGYYDIVADGSPAPNTSAFTEFGYGYESSNGDYGSYNHQKWGTSGMSVNLLSGLAPGTYDLYSYNGANDFNPNNTSQYYFTPTDSGPVSGPNGQSYSEATFTVVPEPSTVMMLLGSGLLGSFYLTGRRRKK